MSYGGAKAEMFEHKRPHIEPKIRDLFAKAELERRRLRWLRDRATTKVERNDLDAELRGVEKMLDSNVDAVVDDVIEAAAKASREAHSTQANAKRKRLRAMDEMREEDDE